MKQILIAVVMTAGLFAAQSRVCIPAKGEVAVTGVTELENRSSSTLYYDKYGAVDTTTAFTIPSATHWINVPSIDLHIKNNSDRELCISVDN